MNVPVVGVGASAGGFEAFKRLVAHLPPDTGLGFVLIQHPNPTHPSNLSEILARVSAIPVRQAADGMGIEPNHVYVIPPNAELEIAGRVLRAVPRGPVSPGQHMPIDHFLRSLARDRGGRAIAVILSGAGADGAAGLEAVKAAGGVTFAQDPGTAEFNSMPRAATETGCVDFVLPPEAIAAELSKLGHHPYMLEDEYRGSMTPEARTTTDHFGPILRLLRGGTDVDFSLYRQNTIRRRIMRRLALHNIGSLEEYRKYLEQDPREFTALQKDLMIGVTQFFRHPEFFEKLKRFVFPRLIQDRSLDDPIRIWVPGCASGEEAYSIAISLHDYFNETKHALQAQIFGTDISSILIEKARRGEYAGNIAADVGPDRLARYFVKVNRGYRVSKALREMCVFSSHDLTQDPPFSKLDLISCRNVLIFLGSVRQSVMALFHHALKPGCFLALGPSEAASGPLFSSVEGARAIFTRNETLGRRHPLYAAGHRSRLRAQAGEVRNDIDLRKEAERILLSRYNGAGIVVDETLEVLEIIGRTPPYLKLPEGRVSLNLLRLVRDTRLFLEVEKLVREVQIFREPARKDRVSYQDGALEGEVNLEVLPLGGAQTRALLILFEPSSEGSPVGPYPILQPRDTEIAKLKKDLADARQRVLLIMEERQSSEEENQNAVQEATSASEELQSLNEELATAKEELQSTNEELITINEELRSNNLVLAEARDFATQIIETVPVPLVVLDADLRIKIANSAFYSMFRISPRDVEGQFLYRLSDGCWDVPGVRTLLDGILPDLKSTRRFETELDFPGIGRRTLVLTARQIDDVQQILLGIEDVTESLERIEASLLESEERFTTMADTAPVMIWVAGTDGACTFFNQRWLAFTGHTMEQELGTGWTESVHPHDLDRCMTTYLSSLRERRSFQMEYRLRRADGEYRWLLDNGVPRFERSGAFVGYIGSCIDITDLKRGHEDNLVKQKLESLGTLASGIAHDFNNLLGGVLALSEVALAELAAGAHPEEELKRIGTTAMRGSEIVRQLMVYAGKESEALELVDLSHTIQEMVELLKVSVSKRAALETDLASDLPAIRANAPQLRQIVMNLITNASEAMGDRPGVIRVSTRRVTVGPHSIAATLEHLAEGDYLQLEVSDNGRGMSPETQARVFDPFFTTKDTGHGLGLAVVQGIVRTLQGTIRLVSAPGSGTTFEILLPCAGQAGQPDPVAASPAREGALQESAFILIVEDEEFLLQAVSKRIRKAGFSVLEASDGSAALDVIRTFQRHIDVLLLDITLPGTSSREVFAEAGRMRPDMNVIVTSAYGREMAVASLAARVDRFIRKPFRLDDLVELIRATISSPPPKDPGLLP